MGLKSFFLVALLLTGCGAAPTTTSTFSMDATPTASTVDTRSASYVTPGEQPAQPVAIAVRNGGIVNPTEPEGFGDAPTDEGDR